MIKNQLKILAISGSTRRHSTNTALLRAIAAVAPADISVEIFDKVGDLPIFSPDISDESFPDIVRQFADRIAASDGLIVSSPEYVHSIPGGLKNAIDWLVSGSEVIGKPIALAHASHRGDDMLTGLRLVLSTVSSGFNERIFFRLPVKQATPVEILERVMEPGNRREAEAFLHNFATLCRGAPR
ncbi:NAD(P)H-dependent oxidoreductase [Asticcacaulis sp. DXS10W]|uniref:NAD(P)H-dependent oxidoreductase n=1 Tax=Asticcacaulis currens TaxID=2984210 RepID=A0ABT5IDJ9_9CAUL|nr:NAD(P)H-dependent oxidoreductase [Asticcacaulis currens]